MNKRVLMVAWEYPPRITGGLGVASKGLATALTALGNTVDMVLPRLTGDEEETPGINLIDFKKYKNLLSPEEMMRLARKAMYFYKISKGVSAYGQYGEAPEVSGAWSGLSESELLKRVNLDFLKNEGLFTGNYSNKIYHEISVYADWVELLASRLDFDIIHAHDWMTYRAALAAGRVSGKPVVCHVHSTEFDRSGQRVNQFIYDLEREAFHNSAMNITVSDYTRNILLDRYAVPFEKIRTVHNGVDNKTLKMYTEDILSGAENDQDSDSSLETSKPGKVSKRTPARPKRKIAPNEKVVSFVGRITFQKGPDYFVRAAKRVIETMGNVRFVMAGTGDMYYRMIDMAANMGIGSYFHYTGFLDNAGVSKLYSTSDLYIMPSVSEPFGITPLEAMLHKVPVIISKQSGVSEVVENAVKIDFWDINQIADGIVNILSDPKLYKKLREGGYEEARRLNWMRPAEKVNMIYDEVLQRAWACNSYN